MKLTFLPADKGDCFLVTGADRAHLLVDGGMRASYRDHAGPELAKLVRRGEQLDRVCVTHIDEDHIAGVIQLLDDTVAWRVHDFQLAGGNRNHDAPETARPPAVGGIWHNGFAEQLGERLDRDIPMLETVATVYAGGETGRNRELAHRHRDLATGVADGIRLSRRIGDRQLKISLNPEFSHKAMVVRPQPPNLRVGGLKVTLVAPFEEDLKNLQKEWNTWLRENRRALADIRRQAAEDERRLRGNDAERLVQAARAQADTLGRRTKVTAPNLASLMLLVEEGNKTALLTADGHHADVLRGLDRAGQLPGGIAHVNVLKIMHHGSEHNIDAEFCRRVIADQYVFCANGAHNNPDLRVVEAVIASRLGPHGTRRPHPEADRPFKVWFNASSATTDGREAAHMREVEKLVQRLADGRQANGRMQVEFRKVASGGLTVSP